MTTTTTTATATPPAPPPRPVGYAVLAYLGGEVVLTAHHEGLGQVRDWMAAVQGRTWKDYTFRVFEFGREVDMGPAVGPARLEG